MPWRAPSIGRARRGWASGLAAALLSSCADPSIAIILEPPPEVTRVAVMFFEPDGAFLDSTGLLERPHGAAFQSSLPLDAAEISEVRAAGFSDAALAVLDLPRREVLEAGGLRPAGPADAVLPAADWEGFGAPTFGVVRVAEVTSGVALTAPWLPPCPTLIPAGVSARVDSRCYDRRCSVEVRQSECVLEGDLAPCGLDFSRLDVDGRGGGAGGRCHLAEPAPDATLTVECESCVGDLYVPPGPPRFDVELRAIVEAPPTPGGGVRDPPSGYLSGLAVLEDRVIVSGHGGRFEGVACAGTEVSSIWVLELEGLRPMGTATAAPCLLALTRDPGRTAVLAGFGGAQFQLARLDERGHTVKSLALSAPAPATHQLSALAVTADGAWLVAGFSSFDLPGRLPGKLALVDSRSLELRALVDTEPTVLAITATRGPVVALSTDPDALILFFDAASRTVGSKVHTAPSRDANKTARYLTYLPGDDLVVASSPGFDAPAIHLVDEEVGWIDLATSYEGVLSPTAIYPWPVGHRRAVVATVGERNLAGLVLFDGELVRFLPGVTEIGFGAATAVDGDGAGRVYFLLAWSGQLARVRPR